MDTSMNKTLSDGLHELMGHVLSSVEFVEDYVQLRFDGACLSAYTLPVVTWGAGTLAFGESGYRDVLCRQIGCRLVQTDVDDTVVSMIFESGATVSISLRDEDYRGPEALQLSLDQSRIWVA
jgi:hypothetical protein